MGLKALGCFLIVLCGAAGSVAMAQHADMVEARKELVRGFVAAFNAHDAGAMTELVSDDIEWLTVDGKSVTEEVTGKDQLRSAMTEYFESCPSCRSRLSDLAATENRATTIEVASWQSAEGRSQQRSVAVYEFAGPFIQRVYYFPAERISPQD